MSPRTRRNLLVVLLVLLALLIAFLLWWFLRPKAAPVVVPPTPNVTQTIPTSTKPTISDVRQQEAAQERVSTASLQTASKIFAERYGSYSAEANFANLTDVLPLMTDAFAKETRAYVATATPPTEYYAVTTHVVTIAVDGEDDAAGTARVTVTTQREEAKGNVQDVSVRYQDLVLTFLRENDTWLVASANWQ